MSDYLLSLTNSVIITNSANYSQRSYTDMSGAEASLVIGLISSIITIIETTYQLYEAVEDEKGLPANFKKAASKLPLISRILGDAEKYIESVQDEDKKAAFKLTLESCKLQAICLQDIFTRVMPDEDDSRWNRYMKAARTIGKGGRIEDLVKGILDNLQLMATNFPEVASPRSKENLEKAVQEVSKMDPSLPDGFEEAPAFAHYGSGSQNVNTGNGSQYNNNSTGNQNNGPGHQYIGTNNIGTPFPTNNIKDQSVTMHNHTIGKTNSRCKSSC
jgi:hypothetical protein